MHLAFTPSAVLEFLNYELLVRIFNPLYHIEYSLQASCALGESREVMREEHAKGDANPFEMEYTCVYTNSS